MYKSVILILLLLMTRYGLSAQEDLMAILDDEQEAVDQTVQSIFKGQRLINGHCSYAKDI